MDSNEVHTLAKALQKALIQGLPPIRLSKNACVSESFSILATIHGLRTSCLLSTLTASKTSLAALRVTLRQYGAKQVSIVVHKASQQLFVVNKTLFNQRWKDTYRRDFFYAIDENSQTAEERIQYVMPEYLTGLLAALSESFLCSRSDEQASGSIVLLENCRDDRKSSSVEGIALAGWLLEYEVIYFYNDIAKVGKAFARMWDKEDDWEEEDVEGEQMANCLAGVPLLLIMVKIGSSSLYQFTFPFEILDQVANKMKVDDCSPHGVCQAVANRFNSRSDYTPNVSISVTHERVVMDRVAM